MSKLSQKTAAPAWYRAAFVAITACMLGFAWRARGDHGWGSFKGMGMVAVCLIMLIVAFFPYKKKFNAEIFPLAVFLTAITNAGYGTFNSQITGLLHSNPPAGIEVEAVNINPLSGVVIMLLVGFGWAPFLCAFIGYYFSDGKRKWWQLIVTVAVFYAVDYVCRATVSHLLVEVINPTAVKSFAKALTEGGVELSPYRAYMSHFSNIGYGKKFPFGRNYYQSIECVSQALGTVATIVYTRFFVKDKKAARVSLASCCGLGAAITIADLTLFFSNGGFRETLTPPSWLTGWGDWEFFTGFFFGLFTALIILAASKGVAFTEENLQPARLLPDKKPLRFIWNYGLMMCFTAAVALVIPIAIRMTDETDMIFGSVGFESEEALVPWAAVIGALALIYPALAYTKKERADSLAPVTAAGIILPVFWGIVFTAYNFLGDGPILHGDLNDYDILTYIAAAVTTVLMVVMLKYAAKNKTGETVK